ncbi:hypothetical protein F7984_03360 [Pradoshia sp. D12]|uniref:hypothetical protein n=1 Tax=Bacillaceae TaxID=186817 RepID=UPI00080AF23F|nr:MULTISPECIES: hypothetical protein [Bacillaceae]OCA88644.1 hypothetical protein A8L44_17280 [Bacillus sp. FJAT-27986]QFK70346.1 hypothetical protein F7984_03360 [Pradoshia sp. D12]TPF70455.1 hypothetical protein FHY44_17655 [Bacillus sp. D12]
MKTIIQSLVVSFVIHIIYIGGSLIVGYITIKTYKPDIKDEWENVKMLQSEVAFGTVGSPLFFLITFIAVALICGIIITTIRKFVRIK